MIKDLILGQFGTEFYGTLANDIEALGELAGTEDRAAMDGAQKCDTLSEDQHKALIVRLNADSVQIRYCAERSQAASTAADILLVSPDVQYRRGFKSGGATFKPVSQSRNDSLVICRLPGASARAAQIESIFVHTRAGANDEEALTDFSLSVRLFHELSDVEALSDPYRQYLLLDVRLYHNKLSDQQFILKASDIVSHCATCPYQSVEETHKYRVVLSLDRVCIFQS